MASAPIQVVLALSAFGILSVVGIWASRDETLPEAHPTHEFEIAFEKEGIKAFKKSGYRDYAKTSPKGVASARRLAEFHKQMNRYFVKAKFFLHYYRRCRTNSSTFGANEKVCPSVISSEFRRLLSRVSGRSPTRNPPQLRGNAQCRNMLCSPEMLNALENLAAKLSVFRNADIDFVARLRDNWKEILAAFMHVNVFMGCFAIMESGTIGQDPVRQQAGRPAPPGWKSSAIHNDPGIKGNWAGVTVSRLDLIIKELISKCHKRVDYLECKNNELAKWKEMREQAVAAVKFMTQSPIKHAIEGLPAESQCGGLLALTPEYRQYSEFVDRWLAGNISNEQLASAEPEGRKYDIQRANVLARTADPGGFTNAAIMRAHVMQNNRQQ